MSQINKCILSLDPGSEKCGFAIVRFDFSVIEKGVISNLDLSSTLRKLMIHKPEVIAMGRGTFASETKKLILDSNPGLKITLVDEKNTTYEARKRYFADNPPKGLWRLVPIGLQIPPCPIDDYAAVIIAERYLRFHHKGTKDTKKN